MSEPKTIFIVTSGEYSDYGIEAVFDSRELAEAMVIGRDCAIEEYTLNPGEAAYRDGRQRFAVRMQRDGTVVRVTPLGWASDDPDHESWSYESRSQCPGQEVIIAIVVSADVWARDVTHAVKIVNEKRAQWIADGRWDREEAVVRTWPQFHNDQIWRVEC